MVSRNDYRMESKISRNYYGYYYYCNIRYRSAPC